MNTYEATSTSVDSAIDPQSVSSITVMDIIPDAALYENAFTVPLKYRHKLGRTAVAESTGNAVYQPDRPIHEVESQNEQPSAVHRLKSLFKRNRSTLETDDETENDETLDEDAESRVTKVRKGLGYYAALTNIKISKFLGAASPYERKQRSEENRLKYAKVEGQRLGYRRSMNWIKRNKTEIAGWAGVSLIGGIALERIGLNSYHLGHFFENSAFTDYEVPRTVVETPEAPMVNATPELRSFDSVYFAGGAGQGQSPEIPIAEAQAKGIDLGVNVHGINYSSSIGPFVGTERMDESLAGGASNMYNDSKADLAAGKVVQYVGYSEGTGVAVSAYDLAVAANGGVAPPNLLPPILIATPYAQGGMFSNSFTKGMVGGVLDNLGIPTDHKLPPGTIVKYYDSDIWANGGNMNPSTLIKNMLGLAVGNHDIPNESDSHYTFTDSDGVIHIVYSRDDQFLSVLEKSGIKIMDSEDANKALQAFFPIGKDENGEFLKPDVRAGLSYMAVAMDRQIDPSGNLHIVQDFMNSLPDEYKELGQRGMDGFNNIAETIGKIQAGEMDPLTGFMSIMGSINSIMGGLQGVSNLQSQSGGSGQSLFSSWDSFAATASATFQSGQDFAPQYASAVQDYFGQFQGMDTSSLVMTSAQVEYGYTGGSPIANQMEPFVSDASTPQGAQSEPYNVPQQTAVTETASLPTDVPTTSQTPTAQTQTVAAPEVASTPAPAEQTAPTQPPAAYTAPVSQPVQQSPTPELVTPVAVPEIVPVTETPTPAVVDTPAVETAPAAPPTEAYVAPVAPEPAPAPVVETPAPAPVIEAPAPVIEAPVLQAPPAPVFEAPSMPAAPSFGSIFGSSSSASSSSSSSSASTPALVTSAVPEF